MVGSAPDAGFRSYLGNVPAEADVLLLINPGDRDDPASFSGATIAAGRGGKGMIAISNAPQGDTTYGLLGADFAAGDFVSDFALNNQREVITVGALSAYGKRTISTVDGDMMLVSVPIFTDTSVNASFDDVSPTIGPDPRGNLGQNPEGSFLGSWEMIVEAQRGEVIDAANYWQDISGLGAYGIAGGVAALMLDANPDLGWRDMQEIHAYSAERTDDAPDTGDPHPWEINGAETWNGGGLHYSARYGFGAVDVYGAVRLAET